MKKERRSAQETITRISTLAVLSALGFVLMAFVQFPYPFAPWLKIEISELVTILAYALYGFPGGLTVALIKTLLNLAVHGPVGLGIGDLTAFITSCMFLLGLFLTSHLFKWFKKGLLFRIFSYLVITPVTAACRLDRQTMGSSTGSPWHRRQWGAGPAGWAGSTCTRSCSAGAA